MMVYILIWFHIYFWNEIYINDEFIQEVNSVISQLAYIDDGFIYDVNSQLYLELNVDGGLIYDVNSIISQMRYIGDWVSIWYKFIVINEIAYIYIIYIYMMQIYSYSSIHIVNILAAE